MDKSFTRWLRHRAVVTAAMLAVVGTSTAIADESGRGDSFDRDGRETASPIKHVIVIIGENRTFDHLFATYQPKPGQKVDNLLSKGIIDIHGAPGPNYGKAAQSTAVDTGTYSISPGGKVAYIHPPAPGTSYAPLVPYTSVADAAINGPGALANLTLAAEGDDGLSPGDLGLLLTGSTGLSSNYPDSRIPNYNSLPNGPYPLSPLPGYDTYGGSPVHRFYQMWQEMDCSTATATPANPSGCLADLFPWVETTVTSGSNGAAQPVPYINKEGDIALGFYNVAQGDVPYLTELANTYSINDNYHQAVMGGTGANHIMLGYADALYYADANGNPATPPSNEIENPNPQLGTNNWYTQDGYGGGSYTNCADTSQPGVAPIVDYLNAMHVDPRCAPNAYYLLNNYNPAYIGNGTVDPVNNGPFTIPPTKQKHIGDKLSEAHVSWTYFGENWTEYTQGPGLGVNPALNPTGYLYCNICNPFEYSTSTMVDPATRNLHIKDTSDLYTEIANGTLPSVSIVKPSTFNDGHPASSKVDLFESFTKRIINDVQANKELWKDTVIFVTVDEGGGYYDSGYVQPVDYFGDGTRIPLIAVSPFTKGGDVSHEYSDHVSITKFIERNWELGPITHHSRDNLPNPKTSKSNPYVPINSPAIGDLWSMFSFSDHDADDDRDGGDDDR
jgi:phospholipase C